MLSKAKLQAREKGAVTRGVYGKKFQVNDTGYSVFVPSHLSGNAYSDRKFSIGPIEFTIVGSRVIGNIPDSWLIDLNAEPVEHLEETEEMFA